MRTLTITSHSLIITRLIRIILVIFYTGVQAQDPPALFQVESGDKGILIPRTSSSSIVDPVNGLLIYDTTDLSFKFYNGTKWLLLTHEDSNQFFYSDQDQDGFGSPFVVVYAPVKPQYYQVNNLDCNDQDSTIHPDGVEICDSIDNNCNGLIDALDSTLVDGILLFADTDQDGYGDPNNEIISCSFPVPGFVMNDLDCDDTDAYISPDAQEVCDGQDNDCDNLIDDQDIVFLKPYCSDCMTCDCSEDSIVLNSTDPYYGALAMGLCNSVMSAAWVYPNGSPLPINSNTQLGFGMLSSFGSNVNPLEGSKLLALSSGTARSPSDPGYSIDLAKSYSNDFPIGFPSTPQSCSAPSNAYDGVGLKVILAVPENADSFSFNFKYYTHDYPTYYCTPYVDQAAVMMTPGPVDSIQNILLDADSMTVDANSSTTIQVCDTATVYPCPLGTDELTGTGFETFGASGWLSVTTSCQPGSVIELVFTIWDSSDAVLSSTLLLDNFQWITN